MDKFLLRINIRDKSLLLNSRLEKFDSLVELAEWWVGHRDIHSDGWKEDQLTVETIIYLKQDMSLGEAY